LEAVQWKDIGLVSYNGRLIENYPIGTNTSDLAWRWGSFASCQLFQTVFSPARRYGPVSVCVCPSQVGVLSKRWTNRAGFRHGSFLPPIPHCVKRGNSSISINKDTSLRNFVPHSGLGQFCFSISIVEMCYRLSSGKVDAQSVINWTVVGQLSWQYLRAPTVDRCNLSQQSSSSVYSTIPLRGFISDSWYLFVQLCLSEQYFNWYSVFARSLCDGWAFCMFLWTIVVQLCRYCNKPTTNTLMTMMIMIIYCTFNTFSTPSTDRLCHAAISTLSHCMTTIFIIIIFRYYRLTYAALTI